VCELHARHVRAHVAGQRTQPPKLNAGRSLRPRRVGGPLADQPTLKLREARKDIGEHLAGGRTRIDAKVQGDELPLLATERLGPGLKAWLKGGGTAGGDPKTA